jgi:hypothetical protein
LKPNANGALPAPHLIQKCGDSRSATAGSHIMGMVDHNGEFLPNTRRRFSILDRTQSYGKSASTAGAAKFNCRAGALSSWD